MRKIVSQSCRIIDNRRLDKTGYYRSLRVADFTSARTVRPGQFVHIKVAGCMDPFFRRAFSIADYDPDNRVLEIIYKVVGKGTGIMGQKTKGEYLDILGPLGNGYSRIAKSKTVVIVAGGVGFPPLYFLAKRLVEAGHPAKDILFFYGGRNRDDLIEMKRTRDLGVELVACTDDGSYGFSGFVTEAAAARMEQLNGKKTTICTCGPEPMLTVVQETARRMGFSGEMALEAPMPCGVGVCLGCIKESLESPQKYVRVCYDGPVFGLGEVKI